MSISRACSTLRQAGERGFLEFGGVAAAPEPSLGAAPLAGERQAVGLGNVQRLTLRYHAAYNGGATLRNDR